MGALAGEPGGASLASGDDPVNGPRSAGSGSGAVAPSFRRVRRVTDETDPAGLPPASCWRRPPVEQRTDQDRTWTRVAVAGLLHPALRALAEAWQRAAEAEGLRPPSRQSFRPTDVAGALGRITLLERVQRDAGGGHTWKYRLVGTEVVTIMQADVTGDTIERFHPPLAAMLRAQFDDAAASGEPGCYAVRTVVDHRSYSYEKIVLPVRSAPGAEIDQIVVASFPTKAS